MKAPAGTVNRQARRVTAGRLRRLARYVPILLLAAGFALGMTQVIAASITFDEGPHLAVGYTTLRTGDFRLQPVHIHPPLANVLAALPLLLQQDLPDPTTISGWEISSLSAITDALVWQYPHPQRIATAGRLPILLLSTLLGALVFRWTRDLAGQTAGTLALLLFTLDPNIIAHSALITTDLTATALMIATLYVVFRLLRAAPRSRQQTRLLVLSGLFLGLAQLAKVSALMLVPVVGALLMLDAWIATRRMRAVGVALGAFALIMALGALVLWAGYGFSASSLSVHFGIFRSLRQHYDLGHPTFALGRISATGWWWYFPLAFALKTPLPILLLGLLTPALLLWRHRADSTSPSSEEDESTRHPPGQGILSRVRVWTALGLFPAAYAAASLLSTVNIGYRHLLPLLPCADIAIACALGQVQKRIPTAPRRIRIAGAVVLSVLLLWLVAGTVGVLPYPLTFFNELAGGPESGHRYLVDSNLDWGQNLWDLKAWMTAHGIPTVAYAHYSPARPEAYGIEATPLPPAPGAAAFAPWNPAPGLYAIGATVLQGPYTPDLNTYTWFRSREPLARLGDALFVYDVPSTPAPGWAVLCVAGMAPTTVAQQLGVDRLRILQPDCSQAVVVPASATPGLVVLPPETPPPDGAEPWLSLRDTQGRTTAQIYRLFHTPAPANRATVEVQGPVTLLGHTLTESTARPGTLVELITVWHVDEVPNRPLSLLAHLVAEDGATVAVGDGLGFPIEQWRPGDVIQQTHRFALPADLEVGTELTLVTGGYWLDTMERWPTEGDSNPIALQTLIVEE